MYTFKVPLFAPIQYAPPKTLAKSPKNLAYPSRSFAKGDGQSPRQLDGSQALNRHSQIDGSHTSEGREPHSASQQIEIGITDLYTDTQPSPQIQECHSSGSFSDTAWFEDEYPPSIFDPLSTFSSTPPSYCDWQTSDDPQVTNHEGLSDVNPNISLSTTQTTTVMTSPRDTSMEYIKPDLCEWYNSSDLHNPSPLDIQMQNSTEPTASFAKDLSPWLNTTELAFDCSKLPANGTWPDVTSHCSRYPSPECEKAQQHVDEKGMMLRDLEDQEWGVRKVVGKELVDGILHYLVEWTPTLLPQTSLSNATDLIDAFETRLARRKVPKRAPIRRDTCGQKRRPGRPRKIL